MSGGVGEWGSGGVCSFHDRFDKSAELRGVCRAIGLHVDREDALFEPHQVAHIRKRRDGIARVVVVLSAREYSDDLPLDRKKHFVLRGERLRGIDSNFVADPAAERPRRMDAEHDGVAIEVESARAGSTDLVGRREVARIYAEKNGRKDAIAV